MQGRSVAVCAPAQDVSQHTVPARYRVQAEEGVQPLLLVAGIWRPVQAALWVFVCKQGGPGRPWCNAGRGGSRGARAQAAQALSQAVVRQQSCFAPLQLHLALGAAAQAATPAADVCAHPCRTC